MIMIYFSVPSHKPKKTPDNYITDSFTDMSIPVYAMVKGVSVIQA